MDTHLALSLLVFAVSSLVVYLLIPPLQRLAFKKGYVVTPRDHAVDIPPAIRKASHHYQIPLTGGLAVLLAFAASMLVSVLVFPGLFLGSETLIRFVGLFVASMLIGLMGLADDIRRLSYKIRLLAASLIMLALLAVTVYGKMFVLPGAITLHIGLPELLVLLLWCLGLSNAINLIDGLDGSAAGIIAIAALWLSLITGTDAFVATIVLTSILASCVAFLAFNFHPASIFLGSTGTLFLGFVLALITIWPPAPLVPNYFFPYAILIFALPLTDMVVVFMVRILHGKNPFTADSWHIHDRVLLTGVSRKKAAVLIWGVSFVCGLLAYLSFRGLLPYLAAAAMVAIVLAAFYLLVIFHSRPEKTGEK